MTQAFRRALVASAFLASILSMSGADAATAPVFRSCDALTARFPNGVAKSPAAAAAAVRDGYGRPATTRFAVQVYIANFRNLDRDRDGTACEN